MIYSDSQFFSSKLVLLLIYFQNHKIFKRRQFMFVFDTVLQYVIIFVAATIYHMFRQSFFCLINVIFPTCFFRTFNIIGNIKLMILFYFRYCVLCCSENCIWRLFLLILLTSLLFVRHMAKIKDGIFHR